MDPMMVKRLLMFVLCHAMMRAYEREKETDEQNGSKRDERWIMSEGSLRRGEVKC